MGRVYLNSESAAAHNSVFINTSAAAANLKSYTLKLTVLSFKVQPESTF